LDSARNSGVTLANGFRNAGRKSTNNACPGKVIAFFAGQRPVKGHKNIIDSLHQRIVSPKTFIGAHSSIESQSAARRKASRKYELSGGRLRIPGRVDQSDSSAILQSGPVG
jgi:hypothetical protein